MRSTSVSDLNRAFVHQIYFQYSYDEDDQFGIGLG